MATLTPLSADDATRVVLGYGLGRLTAIEPIAEGSVNSNYFLVTETGRYFFRIYEEQGSEGAEREWELVDHLCHHKLPVPALVRLDKSQRPGDVLVRDKPTAVFELAPGGPSCQQAVTVGRAHSVGRFLGRFHTATDTFPFDGEGRFTLASIKGRLDGIGTDAGVSPDSLLPELKCEWEQLSASLPETGERGVIHSDLFRDNVHFVGEEVSSAFDWESASQGLRVFDLAVLIHAWCFADAFDFDLAQAVVRGYRAERTLGASDSPVLFWALRYAALRFTVTRITDFHLRPTAAQKDYRRFVARSAEVKRLGPAGLVQALAL